MNKTKQVERAYLVKKIVKLSITNGGCTADLRVGKIVNPGDIWLYPKYPSKTKIIFSTDSLAENIEKFIEQYENLLIEPNCFLGVWLNPNTKEYYIDINTTKLSKNEAITDAVKRSKIECRNIVSIYNPARKQVIYLEKYF